jgi:6-phosphogluconolactonase/glucosamine-6-phosphate isomerase/deaminase
MLADLADHDMPWAQTSIYQVDERIGPADDPLRNLTGLHRALPVGCPARVVPMPVEADDLLAAGEDYAAALPATLDLVQLGLGSDGHTASLIPGDPVLDVTDRDVAVTEVYQDRRRMTLSFPRLARAGAILWPVTGSEKCAALAQLLARDPGIPASGVTVTAQVVFCGAPAAGSTRGGSTEEASECRQNKHQNGGRTCMRGCPWTPTCPDGWMAGCVN